MVQAPPSRVLEPPPSPSLHPFVPLLPPTWLYLCTSFVPAGGVCLYLCLYGVCLYPCLYGVCLYLCLYGVCLYLCLYGVCLYLPLKNHGLQR